MLDDILYHANAPADCLERTMFSIEHKIIIFIWRYDNSLTSESKTLETKRSMALLYPLHHHWKLTYAQ